MSVLYTFPSSPFRPAYILVIAVGMQYFKNAQFPHLEEGKHPLDRPGFSALYIYLNAVLSFLMLLTANGLVELYNLISDLGLRSRSSSEQTEMKKISVCLFGAWIIMLWLHLLEGSYFDVVVRSVWHRVTGWGAGSTSTGPHTEGTGVQNGIGSTDSRGHTSGSSSDHSKVGSPLHHAQPPPPPPPPGSPGSVHARRGSQRQQQHLEQDHAGHQHSAPYSHFPYQRRRPSVSTWRRSDVTEQSAPGTAPPPATAPPIFNKRLFVLKVAVALLHLFSYRFHVNSQYFVVVTAVVAVLPQTFEVLLEFLDLRNRLREIKRELQLQLVGEDAVEEGAAGGARESELEGGGGGSM